MGFVDYYLSLTLLVTSRHLGSLWVSLALTHYWPCDGACCPRSTTGLVMVLIDIGANLLLPLMWTSMALMASLVMIHQFALIWVSLATICHLALLTMDCHWALSLALCWRESTIRFSTSLVDQDFPLALLLT